MSRYSFLLIGTDQVMSETFGSTCHGAGRLMSRMQAKKVARGRNVVKEPAEYALSPATEASARLLKECRMLTKMLPM